MAAAAILNLLTLSFLVAAVYITAKYFIYLRQTAAELLLFVQKSKMAAATMLDFIFVHYFDCQKP